MAFGNVIAAARKAGGFKTQTAFAKRIGCTRSCVNKWEKQNAIPALPMLKKIARVTRMPLGDLVNEALRSS